MTDEAATTSAAPGDDAAHLLVVDDDTRIRNLLKQFLTTNGFRVTVAGTAADRNRSWCGFRIDGRSLEQPRSALYVRRAASQTALASDIDSSTTPATKLAQIRAAGCFSPTDMVRRGPRSSYGGIWQHIAGSGGFRYVACRSKAGRPP